MEIQIHCPCGSLLRVAGGGSRIVCPQCKRPHALPQVAARTEKAWLPVCASTGALVLVGVATLWALLSTFGTGAGGNGRGDGSDGTGVGRGTAVDGNGPGAGSGLADRMARRLGATGNDEGESSSSAANATADTGSKTIGKNPQEDSDATTAPAPNESEKPVPTTQKSVSLVSLSEDVVPDPAVEKPKDEETGKVVIAKGGDRLGRLERRGKAAAAGGRGAGGKDGPSKESEEAVELGLAWLAKVQADDGHWGDGAVFGSADSKTHATGVTGLATLAFLAAGYDHGPKSKYKETVAKALSYLKNRLGTDGKFEQQTFYEQGFAAMALCEAYGMSGDKSLKTPATKAIACIVQNMGAGGAGGFDGGYGYSGPGNDGHVTSAQVMALKAAALAEIEIPRKAVVLMKLKTYYDAAMNDDGTSNYGAGERAVRARRGNDAMPVRTALGLFCRMMLNVDRKDAKVAKIAKLLDGKGPDVNSCYHSYYGTYGMSQMGGEYWTNWNKRVRDPVIGLQIKTGNNAGSWQSQVVPTALYLMTLEVYYRYAVPGEPGAKH